jgi:hypothetical protein
MAQLYSWPMGDDKDIRHGRHCDAALKQNLKDAYGVRSILPRPERRGLPRTGSDSLISLLGPARTQDEPKNRTNLGF